MLPILGTAALLCASALLLGQAILGLAGERRWSWLAPPVGVAAQMLICVPALHLPGRALTTFVLLLLVTLAAAARVLRERDLRPPLIGLIAAGPTALLACAPFAASGRVGVLGVNFNNDMASHLGWAEAYRSADIARTLPVSDDYPLGPHSVVASLAQGLGIEVELAFTGFTLAIVVCLAWTALAALRDGGLVPQALTASLVGLPYIVAGYYGQGSFKEVLEALSVLGIALMLMRWRELSGALRWLPLGLLLAGALSFYSFVGVGWPLVLLFVWLAGLAARELYQGTSVRDIAQAARAHRGSIAFAAAITLVVLVPQLPRLLLFFTRNAGTRGTGIEESSLGNLAGPLSPWTAFGMWDNVDYRLGPIDPFATGMWTGFALAVVIYGAFWWIRRGDWIVPAAAASAYLIWLVSSRTQAPYVTAKALVVLSPLLFVVAARALLEPDVQRRRLVGAGTTLLALVLAFKTLGASWDVLRFSNVGPTDRLDELRWLKPALGSQKTIYLGNSDFIRWELAGVPVRAPTVGIPDLGTRPEKRWQLGAPHDFDSLDAAAYNDAVFVISPRNSGGSAPPPELRLLRHTQLFSLYRRTGRVRQRTLLPEGGNPGKRLDCGSARGKRMLTAGGSAAVRPPSVTVAVPPLGAGQRAWVTLDLPAGTWELDAPYTSKMPVDVTIPGQPKIELPANLDRPGPRWRIGSLTLTRPTRQRIGFHVQRRGKLTSPYAGGDVARVEATRAGGVNEVPVRKACGKIVDYLMPPENG